MFIFICTHICFDFVFVMDFLFFAFSMSVGGDGRKKNIWNRAGMYLPVVYGYAFISPIASILECSACAWSVSILTYIQEYFMHPNIIPKTV